PARSAQDDRGAGPAMHDDLGHAKGGVRFAMRELLSRPWPWYVAGPLIGLMVPTLLIFGNKTFGVSSTLRQICAACFPGKIPFFQYDWRKEAWNLVLVVGIVVGGILGGIVFKNPEPVRISAATVADLQAAGIAN